MLSSIWEYIKRLVKKVLVWIPGVFVTVLCINTAIALAGISLLTTAAIAGMAVILSGLFVLAAAPSLVKKAVLYFLVKYGWLVDLVVTVILTVVGFKISVTMGLVGMLVGFNLSAALSLMRLFDKVKSTRFAHVPQPKAVDLVYLPREGVWV